MPEQEIYSQFKSHWDDDRDPIPESGSGDDTHTVNVPSGKQFHRYNLIIESQTMLSTATVTNAPQPGATGNQTIKVRWNFNRFGKIAYTLKAFSDDSNSPVAIRVGTNNWAQTSYDTIKQRRKLRLDIVGLDASTMIEILRKAAGLPPLAPTETSWRHNLSGAVGSGEVAMAAVIAAALVAMFLFLVILIICLYAINQNYYVDIDYQRKGPMPFDDTLQLTLEPR